MANMIICFFIILFFSYQKTPGLSLEFGFETALSLSLSAFEVKPEWSPPVHFKQGFLSTRVCKTKKPRTRRGFSKLYFSKTERAGLEENGLVTDRLYTCNSVILAFGFVVQAFFSIG